MGFSKVRNIETFFGEELRELDLTDDRLETLLRYLNCDGNWYSFEEELGGSLLQVYDIKPERVRLDPTFRTHNCHTPTKLWLRHTQATF